MSMAGRSTVLLWLLVAGCLRTGDPGALDLTADFLRIACVEPAGERFARAWLAHERRAWEVYGPLYYADGGPEREVVAAARAVHRDEVCRQVRAFSLAAPAVLRAVRPAVTRLAGAAPRAR